MNPCPKKTPDALALGGLNGEGALNLAVAVYDAVTFTFNPLPFLWVVFAVLIPIGIDIKRQKFGD